MKTKPFIISLGLRQDCECVLPPLLFIIYMDKIDKDSFFSSGVIFGKYNVRRLLFADDLTLLNLNKSDLQYALDRFSDACLDAGMKISTTKLRSCVCQGTLSSVLLNKSSNSPADGDV